jgi:hypothetical protein
LWAGSSNSCAASARVSSSLLRLCPAHKK